MAKSTATKTRRRSPKEGSVYPFRDGWRGAVTWTDADGKAHKRTVAGATSDEARKRLDALRARLATGTLAPHALTVAEYLEPWILRYRQDVRPSTWRTAEMHVRVYLVPALGKLPLETLTEEDVEAAMARFLESGRPDRPEKRGRGRQNATGVSPMTVRHILTTLRRALTDAVRHGRIVRNVAATARPPRAVSRPIVYLAAPDLRRLLRATAEDELGPLYALAASTGLRLGELLGLTWADVTGATLTVRRSLARARGGGWELAAPKSDSSRRTLPLPAAARQALETERTRQRFAQAAAGDAWQDREGLVFADAVGRHLRPEAVSRRFGIACKAAGLPVVPFHALRHSAATAMLAQGVPLAVISQWLGHSGIAITVKHYAAVVPELHNEAAEAMDRALAGAEA